MKVPISLATCVDVSGLDRIDQYWSAWCEGPERLIISTSTEAVMCQTLLCAAVNVCMCGQGMLELWTRCTSSLSSLCVYVCITQWDPWPHSLPPGWCSLGLRPGLCEHMCLHMCFLPCLFSRVRVNMLPSSAKPFSKFSRICEPQGEIASPLLLNAFCVCISICIFNTSKIQPFGC